MTSNPDNQRVLGSLGPMSGLLTMQEFIRVEARIQIKGTPFARDASLRHVLRRPQM
jgi:hypothetical protein